MTGAVLSLRAAILARCAGDAELASLLAGGRIHDEPPRAAEPVYAMFGDVTARDWSTGSDAGHEQSLALVVVGRPGSAAAALAVADRLAALLHEAALPLGGHRLVNLRLTETAVARDEKTNLARVTLRLRAVTEAL
jgi:hypothetical protein